MAVSSTTTRTAYVGDGTTNPLTIPWIFWSPDDIQVYSIVVATGVTTLWTRGSQYTITGGAGSTGAVVPSSGTVVGTNTLILLNPVETHLTSYVPNEPFPSEVVQTDFDRLTQMVQSLNAQLGYAISVPYTDTAGINDLPTTATRAGKYIAFDGSGQPTVSAGTGNDSALRTDLANGLTGPGNTLVAIVRTAAEVAASVTPTNYGYAPGPTIDPRRYHIAGTIGTAADDLASINTAISVMKQLGGGQIIIPPEYSSSMAVPVLGLSASQAGSIRDLRLEVSGQLGAIVETIEARDGSGGYASEWQIRGHQNPGVVLQTLSDGTAPGYTKVNYACSFVGRTNAGGNNFQLLVDPYFLAYRGEFSLIAYPGSGTFSEAVYVGADANSKNRWNFQTNRFASVAGSISATTNATPIVVTLSANHNVPTGQYCNVGITGTGITGLDGSWKASATAVNQFTLLNSTAPGSTASSGTCTFYPRTMRAILNVPAVQGGTESVAQEGSNVIFTTTAAVGWVLKDLTDTLIGGLTYNTGPAGMRATGIKGISQSTTVANNLAGTDTFSAATTKVVTFANNETNANYRVMITWTADPGAGVRWWVSGKGTTGFTVNVSTANSATFDWMIIRD